MYITTPHSIINTDGLLCAVPKDYEGRGPSIVLFYEHQSPLPLPFGTEDSRDHAFAALRRYIAPSAFRADMPVLPNEE